MSPIQLMSEHLIEFNNVCKSFDNKDKEVSALHSVTGKIEEGSVMGVIGRSGAGKSTFLRCINGLEKPDSGKIVVDGVDVVCAKNKQLLKLRRKVGMIFQHFNLISRRNVLQNVLLPLENCWGRQF